MPLNKGCSLKAFGANIKEMLRKKRPGPQAIAAAYSQLRKCLPSKLSKKAVTQKWSPKMIVETARRLKKKNPYPLLIATANPVENAIIEKYGLKYGETSTPVALKEFRQRYGAKAVIQPKVVDIPGVKKQILIGRGSLDRIDYTHNVKGSRIPNEPHTHKQGDTGDRKIRPANTYLADTVGGKVTIAVSRRKHVNNQGYYNG